MHRRLLGNILILASFLFLSFIYYPFIGLYFSPAVTPVNNQDYSITIPKINAFAPIIPNVNPWQKEEYLKALSQGVAQAQGNPYFLFAHSSDMPWRVTSYNTPFLRLGELREGDLIFINQDNTKRQYKVIGKKEVWPNQVEYFKEGNENKLVLMTCTPVGTSLKRLLIFAQPI